MKTRLKLLAGSAHLSFIIFILQKRLKIFRSSLTARQRTALTELLQDCREARILLGIYPLLLKK